MEGAFACCAGRLIPENNAVPVARAYLDSAASWPLVVLGTANYNSPGAAGAVSTSPG